MAILNADVSGLPTGSERSEFGTSLDAHRLIWSAYTQTTRAQLSTMPAKPPLEALKSKKGNNMSSKSKVSSWMEKNDNHDDNGSDDGASDAESSSAASYGRPNGANGLAGDDDVESLVDVEDNEETDEVEEEEEVDWEKALGRLRLELEDPSKKRRKAFIERYLNGTADCTLFVMPDHSE